MASMASMYYRLSVRLAMVIFAVAIVGAYVLPSVEMKAWQARVAERGAVTWTMTALDPEAETYPALDLGLTLTSHGAERTWAHLTAANEDLRAMRPATQSIKLWGIFPLTRLVAIGESTAHVEARCAAIAADGAPCALGAVSAAMLTRYLEPGEIVAQMDGPEHVARGPVTVSADAADALLTRQPAPPAATGGLLHLGPPLAEPVVRAAWSAGVTPLMPPTDVAGKYGELIRQAGLIEDRLANRLRPPAATEASLAIGPFLPLLPEVALDDPSLITLSAVGDIMMGTNYPSSSWLNPDLEAGARAEEVLDPALVGLLRDSDVAFGNLEGVLFDGTAPAKSCERCYAFRGPEHYADILADAGFTVMSLANNHSGDFGEAGRSATRAALDRAAIAYAGLDTDGARTASLSLPSGVRVGVVAFAPNSGTLSLHDYPRAVALVSELKASHDLVLVSFHGGAEGSEFMHVPSATEIYYGEDRGNVRRFSREMVKAGADLVVGHGPHVPRGMEVYRGKLIAYSLGNFWTYAGMRSWGVLGLGPVLQVKMTPDGRLAALRIVATRQAGRGVPALDPMGEARALVLDLTRRDFPDSHGVLTGRTRAIAELHRQREAREQDEANAANALPEAAVTRVTTAPGG